jgi:hypothetical protein
MTVNAAEHPGQETDSGRQKRLVVEAKKNWPTCRASDAEHGGPNQRDSSGAPALPSAVNWTTPTREDCRENPATLRPSRIATGRKTDYLSRQVQWPTPRSGKVTDETEEAWTARQEAGGVSTPPLTLAVKMNWATPKSATSGPDDLVTQVAKGWPTPASRDVKGCYVTLERKDGKMRGDLLPDAVRLAGPPAPENPSTTGNRPGQLNPDWVATLMGYPPDWCHLPAETLSRLMATR